MLHFSSSAGQYRQLLVVSSLLMLLGLTGPADAESQSNRTDPGQTLDLRVGDSADICDPTIPQIRVSVNGVESYGILTVEIYNDDEENFLSREGRLRRVRVAAQTGPQKVCVNVSGAGTYALAAYHDQDGDRQLGRKWNFLPKEPFALSNDPRLKLRKPRHREAAFQAGALGADIEVTLRGAKPDA